MNKIEITINGKTHSFNQGDDSTIKNMPWNDRKQLIEVLEQIKQVEYVDNKSPTKIKPSTSHEITKTSNPASPTKGPIELDQAVKPGEGDVDSIMSRLILEQKSTQKPIPDKSAVIKWMLVVIGIIIAIAVVS